MTEFYLARDRAVYLAGLPPFRSPLSPPWGAHARVRAAPSSGALRALYYGFIAADRDHDHAMDVAARHWRFIGDILEHDAEDE